MNHCSQQICTVQAELCKIINADFKSRFQAAAKDHFVFFGLIPSIIRKIDFKNIRRCKYAQTVCVVNKKIDTISLSFIDIVCGIQDYIKDAFKFVL